MKLNRLILTSAIALLPMGAFGADFTLDPSLGNNLNYAVNVCDNDPGTGAPNCPTPGVLEGTATFTIAFTHPGIENAGASFSFTPSAGGMFTTFEWVFKDPSNTEIAHGSTGNNSQIPTDVAVGPGGDYTYMVHYILTSSTLSSAAWSLNITTGPSTGQVPEPGTLALIAIGLIGAGVARRRKV